MPEIVKQQPSYVIAAVVESRWNGNMKSKFVNRSVQYLVSWKGYGPEENSWKPNEMLEGTASWVLLDSHKRYQSKPSDHTVNNQPSRGKQHRGSWSKNHSGKEGSSVTTKSIGSYSKYTPAHMPYLLAARESIVQYEHRQNGKLKLV